MDVRIFATTYFDPFIMNMIELIHTDILLLPIRLGSDWEKLLVSYSGK